MTKLSRLINSELYKILLRPITYLFMALLFVAILFSFLSFQTPDREQKLNFYNKSSLTTNQAVVTEFNTTSESYGKYNTDKLITEAEQKIAFYQILKSSQTSTIKSVTDLKTLVAHIQNTYNQLKSTISVGISNFDTTSAKISAQYIKDLIGYVTSLQTTYDTILNYSIPIVLVTSDDNTKFNALLTDILTILQPKDENGTLMVLGEATSYTTYFNIIRHFENQKELNSLERYINKMQDAVDKISDDDLKDMQKVVNGATTYLSSLNKQLQRDVTNPNFTPQEAKEQASKYHIIGAEIQAYVNNKIMSLLFSSSNDIAINNLVNNYSELLQNALVDKSKTQDDSLYLYKIREQLIINEHLLTNPSKLSLTDYSNALSTIMSSGNDISAFDFTFYGLQICSIVIIIFVLIYGAGMIAGEQTNGTLAGLVSKPFSRNKIISSKILATLLFGTLWLLLCAVLMFAGGSILFGVDLTPIVFTLDATWVIQMSPIWYMLIYIALLILQIYVFTLIAVAVSTIFRHHNTAIALSLGIYVCAMTLNFMFGNTMWIGFLPVGNFDLFRYFGGTFIDQTSLFTPSLSVPLMHNTNLVYSALYTLIVIVLLELVTHLTFKNRDIRQ